jgi:hypothetical protein
MEIKRYPQSPKKMSLEFGYCIEVIYRVPIIFFLWLPSPIRYKA